MCDGDGAGDNSAVEGCAGIDSEYFGNGHALLTWPEVTQNIRYRMFIVAICGLS